MNKLMVVTDNTTSTTTLAPLEPVTNENWPLFVTFVSISSLCLLVTIILYLLTYDKQNCQGWTQFSYLVTLLLFNVVFIPALCPGLTKGTKRNMGCFTLSVLNQFFFVSSKMWLIIISVDMYCTIRKPRMIIQNTQYLSRLVIYSVIGWIFPTIFVTAGIILNWKNRKKLPMSMTNTGLWTTFPDYGYLHCRTPSWFVWEIFVFGNCVFHFFMFGLIFLTICRQRESFTSADSRTTRRKQSSLVLLLRLFIVVGLSWSYIAIQDLLSAGNINTKQTWFWHVFRSVFLLQGVFISVITITNGHTLSNLQLKFPKLKAFLECCQRRHGRIIRMIRLKFGFCLDETDRKVSIQSCVSQRTTDTII